MQRYCDRHHAWLAPHGKTTMAPQIWADQLRAGAWAITVANIFQLQVCATFGIPRVIVANELVGDYEMAQVARYLTDDSDLEIIALVDSLEGVSRLAAALRAGGVQRRLGVLVELGMPGGRCGVRTTSELQKVVAAVLRHRKYLRLAGLEGYEGIISGETPAKQLQAIDTYLARLAAAVRLVQPGVETGDQPFLVSAGGSAFFDRVVIALGRRALPEAQLVLRPGTYVSHDTGYYDRASPMGRQSTRPIGVRSRLKPALEIWAHVLSRPQRDLVLLGMGRRDVPTDAGLPNPLRLEPLHGQPKSCDKRFVIFAVNDQHAYMRVPPNSAISVGDMVVSGISHPCTAFDRWQAILVMDSKGTVTGALRTFF
jgi:D-serine dehydratase